MLNTFEATGPIIEWPKSFFTSEKIEYLCRIFTKGADSFTTDKGMFIAHIHQRNVDESCFEVLQLP
jgi:hypothetical protein